jgi:two-component system LytT family sensor kinase
MLRPEEEGQDVEVVVGVLAGLLLAGSLRAGWHVVRAPRRVVSPEGHAIRAAVHAATVMLPDLRRGLGEETAGRVIEHLLALTQAPAIALTDGERLLAFAGVGADHHRAGDPSAPLVAEGRNRVDVEPRLDCGRPDCPLRAAVSAPLVVAGERAGTLAAFYDRPARLRLEEARAVQDAARLVAAQLELAALDAQGERLARAELRALRAQISPHFIFNALAAVASFIHTRPDQARELLTEFAEFTRYAFRSERPYVQLADELRYVETYLRLEQARFGDRLAVRVQVAPEVLSAVVPVLSLQPLVENAVRHGVESRPGRVQVELIGHDRGADVELVVADDGAGVDLETARAALAGEGSGIGLANVQARLQTAYGPGYGLTVAARDGGGTEVRMTVPKFRAGVRAA